MTIRRARPWLGTLVSMHVDGLAEAHALEAIDAAFAEVAAVHQAMSFHGADSDLSRLHRTPAGHVVEVDAHTVAVLRLALAVAAASQGVFDPTVAPTLVDAGLLPRPRDAIDPDPQATWHDIALLDARHVRLARAAWLDLGGIAKGYAVDCAVDVLRGHGATQVLVDAGGDLRVAGATAMTVHIAAADGTPTAAVSLLDAALASSSGARWRHDFPLAHRGPHVDGRTRQSRLPDRAASVVAPTCAAADALTKVALALPPDAAAAVLAQFDAHAAMHDAVAGWRELAAA